MAKRGTGRITYVKRSEYDRIFEKIMLETRLTRGMELAGLPQGRKFMDCVSRMELGGLLTRQEGRIVLTNRGLICRTAWFWSWSAVYNGKSTVCPFGEGRKPALPSSGALFFCQCFKGNGE